jgi:hypothetical protein
MTGPWSFSFPLVTPELSYRKFSRPYREPVDGSPKSSLVLPHRCGVDNPDRRERKPVVEQRSPPSLEKDPSPSSSREIIGLLMAATWR